MKPTNSSAALRRAAAQEGDPDAAIWEIAMMNKRLAFYLLRKLTAWSYDEDLQQIAMEALFYAVKAWDPDRERSNLGTLIKWKLIRELSYREGYIGIRIPLSFQTEVRRAISDNIRREQEENKNIPLAATHLNGIDPTVFATAVQVMYSSHNPKMRKYLATGRADLEDNKIFTVEETLINSEDGREFLYREVDLCRWKQWIYSFVNKRGTAFKEQHGQRRGNTLFQKHLFVLCYRYGLDPEEMLQPATRKKYKTLKRGVYRWEEIADAMKEESSYVKYVDETWIRRFKGAASTGYGLNRPTVRWYWRYNTDLTIRGTGPVPEEYQEVYSYVGA